MNRTSRLNQDAHVYLLKHSRDSGKVNPFFRLFSFFLKIKTPLQRPFTCLNVNGPAGMRDSASVVQGTVQRTRSRYTAAAH